MIAGSVSRSPAMTVIPWITVLYLTTQVGAFNYSISLNPSSIDTLYVGHEVTVFANVTISKDSFNLFSVEVKDHKVVEVANLTLSESSIEGMAEMRLTLRGRRLGQTVVSFSINHHDNGTVVKFDQKLNVIVLREVTINNTIFQIVNIVFIVAVVFFLGCELDVKIIVAYLRRPLGPGIGFFSQFVMMPLLSTGIAFLLPMDRAFGFGLLTVGCSPGGGGSNVWAILLNGDLNLSMTMTFISSICAIGMMPLWLFILGRLFIDESKVIIPYSSVAINLLQVIVPCVLGLIINWRRPQLAKRLSKLLQPLAIFYVVMLLFYGTYTNIYMYELMYDYPIVIPAGALLPWLGFVVGTGLSYLFRLGWTRSITVGLETGYQNVGVAMLILLYSMPKPTGEMAAVITIVVTVFTPIPLLILLAVIKIKAWRERKEGDKKPLLKTKLLNSALKPRNPNGMDIDGLEVSTDSGYNYKEC